jgi:hypothetical protein
MQITFTLQSQYTGTEYVAGPFNISGTTSGNVTYELATGVTKNQLISGYEVTTEYSTITGGTIQSTGTCTNSEPWLIGAAPTTVDLQVYGKDLDLTPANASIYYTINSGTAVYLTTLDPLTNNCSFIGEITGLTLNDVVVIGTDQTYALDGAPSSTCPANASGDTTHTHTIGVTSGLDYVAITIDSSNNL